jgi:iron complex outermembrane recepter protein
VQYRISIREGQLGDALIALGLQTGESIGLPGNFPKRKVRALQGTMSIEQALQRLLKDSGWRAVPTGPLAWRIEAAPPKAKPPAPPRPVTRAPKRPPVALPEPALPRKPEPAPEPVAAPEIVVTATKRGDTLQTAPLSAHVVIADDIAPFGILPGTGQLATLDDGLVLTNLGPGRNRSFIRGVADSPFNGVTQSTVALEIDDARVTYNAPDPDLRLVDIDRVELLEGPQGPLHGSGALGGVYRIVPNAPDLSRSSGSFSTGLEALQSGSTGASGAGIINLPLVQDRLGLRAVAYATREPGWIDRDGVGGQNSNTSRLLGGRAALRWKPDADWTVDLAGTVQLLHVADSQYATSSMQTYRRAGTLAEPHDNDFINGRLTVKRRVGSTELVSVTSWTTHEVDSTLDATPAGAIFGLSGPLRFEDDRLHTLFNQELRLSGGERLRWLAGLSYLSARTQIDAEFQPLTGGPVLIGNLNQMNSEVAAFGDLSLPLSQSFRLDAGARVFRATSDDERKGLGGAVVRRTQRINISPSASISWTPNDRHFVWLRYASAFRPSGISPFAPATEAEFESDELQSFELGTRLRSADHRLSASGTAYLANWDHIQSDYLLPNGLIATRNSGTGTIYGLQLRADWRGTQWQLSSGVDLQHARLEKPADGLVLPADHALPIVPDYKAHLGVRRVFALSAGEISLGARLSALGKARLSLDPLLDRRIGARQTLDLDASFASKGWLFEIGLDNALGSHAETFGYGNPFSATTLRQRTPLRPRALRISVRKSWP